MTFDYQLTEDDFVAAQLCHIRNNFFKKRLGYVSIFIFSFAALASIVAEVYALIVRDMQLARELVPVAALLLVWLFFAARLFWFGAPFRKQFRKTRATADAAHTNGV